MTGPTNGPPIRVCHVSAALDGGGLERLIHQLATVGDRSGFEHQFVSLGTLGVMGQRLRQEGFVVHALELAGDRWRVWRRLVGILRRMRPDVVHCHNTYAQLFGASAGLVAGVHARLTTQHGTRGADSGRARLHLLIGDRLVHSVVAVSPDGRQRCVADDRLLARKIVVIPNGVEPGPPGVPDGRGPAVAIGRLVSGKGYAVLLDAWALLAQRGHRVRLDILGDGPDRADLEDMIDRLDLASVVRLVGFTHDVAGHLRAAGLYVSASHAEGLSLALLEAMAAGLPVVVTDVGGQAWALGPEPYGIVVPAGDHVALADAVERVVTRGPDADASMATRRRAVEHFSIAATALAYEQRYRSLVGGHA